MDICFKIDRIFFLDTFAKLVYICYRDISFSKYELNSSAQAVITVWR